MATSGTQVTGLASETVAAAQTNGFLGWSPLADRTIHQAAGGTPKGTYANNTAYAVGDVVVYNGATYRAIAAVSSANVTAPALGATWADATNHRSTVESTNTSHVQNYR